MDGRTRTRDEKERKKTFAENLVQNNTKHKKQALSVCKNGG
jgi:hypothetical protein